MVKFSLRGGHTRKSAWPHIRSALGVGLLLSPTQLMAQRVNENATEQADDAFGETVGLETIGIYTETNVRGFNPQQAGNSRIDGVYFDQLVSNTGRVKEGGSIRVGDSALNFWSPAPTGIVANRFKTPGDKTAVSLSLNLMQYNGHIQELDLQLPVIENTLSIATGIAHGNNQFVDGSGLDNYAFGFIPFFKVGGFSIKPVFSGYLTRTAQARPLITTNGPYLPEMPKARQYLGQDWANNKIDQFNNGITVNGMITDTLGFRGGAFQSRQLRKNYYTEIYAVQDETGLARHRLLSDPRQNNYANSWEALFYKRFNSNKIRHTFLAGVRSRYRHIESGGSDLLDFGLVQLGETDPEPKPVFDFSPVNLGTLKQTTYSLGYFGRMKNVGQLSLGIHKSQYDASFQSSAATTKSTASPWLYNMGIRVKPFHWLSVYAAYVTGLEDSGSAPENALNRNQQLPASRTKQMDGGVNIKIGKSTLVASLFQIEKPYFSFDSDRRYVELGTVRHRGAELSFAGNLTERLHILAGAVVMDPIVTGQARDLGIVGERPVGVPKIHSRIDMSYRTNIGNDLTFTATAIHDGKRAASANTYAELGGKQLFLPSFTTIDLGMRKNLNIAKSPVSLRMVVSNIFDTKSWKTIASNVLQQDDRRRVYLYLLADF